MGISRSLDQCLMVGFHQRRSDSRNHNQKGRTVRSSKIKPTESVAEHSFCLFIYRLRSSKNQIVGDGNRSGRIKLNHNARFRALLLVGSSPSSSDSEYLIFTRLTESSTESEKMILATQLIRWSFDSRFLQGALTTPTPQLVKNSLKNVYSWT